jgi:ABC-type dipeptide/oligopeptide/nickel transport system permease component
MARFLVRRLLFAVVLLVCTSSAALFLTRLAPGDVTAQLGPTASRSEIESTRARFDLDRSPISQWLRSARW